MKTWKQRTVIGIFAIIALVFFACGNDPHTHTWGEWHSNADGHWKECTAGDGANTAEGSHTGNPCTVCGYETPHVPQSATITQNEGLGFNGTVKISTNDLYLDADWNTTVASVITALNAAYTAGPPPSKTQFTNVFGGNGVEIVLVNDLDNDFEVRDGEFRTLYLKTSSIATAVYGSAVQYMTNNASNVTKASPAKGGVFLANVPDSRIKGIIKICYNNKIYNNGVRLPIA
jgi:hypothetical protein